MMAIGVQIGSSVRTEKESPGRGGAARSCQKPSGRWISVKVAEQ